MRGLLYVQDLQSVDFRAGPQSPAEAQVSLSVIPRGVGTKRKPEPSPGFAFHVSAPSSPVSLHSFPAARVSSVESGSKWRLLTGCWKEDGGSVRRADSTMLGDNRAKPPGCGYGYGRSLSHRAESRALLGVASLGVSWTPF